MKHQGNDACLWEREGSDNNTYQRDQACLTFESYTKEKFISIGLQFPSSDHCLAPAYIAFAAFDQAVHDKTGPWEF